MILSNILKIFCVINLQSAPYYWTSATLVKGRRDIVYVGPEAVNRVIGEVEALGSLVSELKQKMVAMEETQSSGMADFGFRLLNLERSFKSTRDDIRTLEGNVADRFNLIHNDLNGQKNLTDNLVKDHCTSILHQGGVSDVGGGGQAGGSKFCTKPPENLSIRSIPARYILGNVVVKPKARLYKGANLTGTFEDFNFESRSNPECLTLTKLYGGMGSLNTFGTCVRLYNQEDCWVPWIRNPRTFETPKSMAFYPQLRTDNNLDVRMKQEFLKEVKSIGPCFENELDDSQLEVNARGLKGYKKLQGMDGTFFIPDLAYVGDGGNYEGTISRPIYGYRTGYKGRVEFVRASMDQNHVVWGRTTRQLNVTKANMDFYTQLDVEEGDQLGHFVGSSFGGLPEDLPFHNVFPQTRQNRQAMAKLESKIVEALSEAKNSDRLVSLRINVDYQSRTSTRPTGLSYLIHFDDGLKKINYLTNMRTS